MARASTRDHCHLSASAWECTKSFSNKDHVSYVAVLIEDDGNLKLRVVCTNDCIHVGNAVSRLLDVFIGTVKEDMIALQKCEPFRICQRCSFQHLSDDIVRCIDELLCRSSSHVFPFYFASERVTLRPLGP
jgi:hypothetical protein